MFQLKKKQKNIMPKNLDSTTKDHSDNISRRDVLKFGMISASALAVTTAATKAKAAEKVVEKGIEKTTQTQTSFYSSIDEIVKINKDLNDLTTQILRL